MSREKLVQRLVRDAVQRAVTDASVWWSPSRLFANGEDGYWFDGADSSHMFQEGQNAITPAASDGDPIGLVIDKSKGGLNGMGPNLLTNGSFDTDLSGWTTAQTTWVDGRAYVSTPDTSYAGLVQAISGYPAGTWFEVTFETELVSGSASMQIDDLNTNGTVATSGIYTAGFGTGRNRVIIQSSGGLQINPKRATAASFYIDNITMREIPGNHWSQTTTAVKPTLRVEADGRRYLDRNNSDDYVKAPCSYTTSDEACVAYAYRTFSTGNPLLLGGTASNPWGWAAADASGTSSAGNIVHQDMRIGGVDYASTAYDIRDELHDLLAAANTVIAQGLINADFSPSGYNLGAYNSGAYGHPPLYEAISVKRDLTSDELDLLHEYLSARAGVKP